MYPNRDWSHRVLIHLLSVLLIYSYFKSSSIPIVVYSMIQSSSSSHCYVLFQINVLCEDNFGNLALSGECLEKLKHASSSLLSFVSPLLERTAIVLPSSFFAQHGDKQGDDFIHMLDFLCHSKFDICGMKMVLFSEGSAKELCTILNYEIKASTQLLTGACMLMCVINAHHLCFPCYNAPRPPSPFSK